MIGQAARTTISTIGCPKQDDLDKVKDLIRERDFSATAKAAQRGNCQQIQPGSDGIVEDMSFLHSSTCIRPQGEPDCLWVMNAFVGTPSE